MNTSEGLQWQAKMDTSYPHVGDGFDDFNGFDVELLAILKDTVEDPAWEQVGDAVSEFVSWASNASFDRELEWEYDYGDEEDEDIVEKSRESHRNIDILQLDMKKQLGLTATMKELDTEDHKIDNMDESIFGKIIDQKSILWGIENKYLCDYYLSVPKITAQELEELIDDGVDGLDGSNKLIYGDL